MKRELDSATLELIQILIKKSENKNKISNQMKKKLDILFENAKRKELTFPIIEFFISLKNTVEEYSMSAPDIGFKKEELIYLAKKHQEIDEHGVSVGGRIIKAANVVSEANHRIMAYVENKNSISSGIEIWDRIQGNIERIKKLLGMNDDEWNSYEGQLKHAINSVNTLSKIIDLPKNAIEDIMRITKSYRMRLTPYYASLIMPLDMGDPILIQSVPTGEMIDNSGIEIEPVASDHSPARLIDQFYPRVVSLKVTNMCAMYCTHCLRIAHIGKKDKLFSNDAYSEALDYIKKSKNIRDVLITGGDAFILPNEKIKWILKELDNIKHVKVKRLGTRIPVTCPMRIDEELLRILSESNKIKPIRVVSQINTAREITPVSRRAFRRLSENVSAVLDQIVLLKGINDSKAKMWKLCETLQDSYVRPYYVFNCSYRNPQFSHLRVPIEVGRDIIEGMYGNISGDAIPKYIATAGGKIPLHRDNVIRNEHGIVTLKKPWNGEMVEYPDADRRIYENNNSSFRKYIKD